MGGGGARASCTRADTGAGGRAEGQLSWATQAGNRTRLMLCDRQKPATPFNVAPIRALPVLASFLERRLCQTTGGRAAACQLPNMTFAGWAAEPQRGTSAAQPFIPSDVGGTCAARRPLRAARDCARVFPLSAGLSRNQRSHGGRRKKRSLLRERKRSHTRQWYERGRLLPTNSSQRQHLQLLGGRANMEKQRVTDASAGKWKAAGDDNQGRRQQILRPYD